MKRSYTQRYPPIILALCTLVLVPSCRTTPRPGTFAPRTGDEIVVAGVFVHTGTPVVLWLDAGGYDAYRVERRFSPVDESAWETSRFQIKELTTPNRYGLRRGLLEADQVERVRGGGWDLPLLQGVIDQFVIHFDVAGTSRECFKVLHDLRGLSVHFMIDLDGTIYQTLDLKERAWHATTSNTRSVGVEMANIGARPPSERAALDQWYRKDSRGETCIVFPESLRDGGQRTPNFIPRPARPEPISGRIQGQELVQYDFTPQQYEALIKLTAALCKVFPKLRCDYPRDGEGHLLPQKLPDDQLQNYQGLLGHFHVQTNKVDPGPAFQWDLVIEGARKLLGPRAGVLEEKPASSLVRVPR